MVSHQTPNLLKYVYLVSLLTGRVSIVDLFTFDSTKNIITITE